MATNPYEMIPLFDPGRASNVLDDIEWERRHGRAKRVRTIANVLLEEGWKAQVLAAKEGPREEAPLLNEDAAMMLVDAWLEEQGAKTGCTHADVRSAFDYLTSPLVARAIHGEEGISPIILLGPRQRPAPLGLSNRLHRHDRASGARSLLAEACGHTGHADVNADGYAPYGPDR